MCSLVLFGRERRIKTEGKVMNRKIVITVIYLMLAGCASRQVNPTTAPTTTPTEVIYSIVDSYILPGIKRSIVVQLNRKVSEETLRDIAFKLRAQDQRRYERTFISYILPGMKLNSGAWATTHFDPNLEIRILGSTLEQEEFFRRDADNSPQSAIGTWLYQILGAKDMNRTWTIYRQDNSFYIKTTYIDGNGETTHIEEKPHPKGRFFQTKKQATDGEYFLLDGQGNLQLWDKEGWIATAKKLK